MVMVLLFLGVIFLLLGFRALGSSGNSDDYSSTPASSAASSGASAAPSSTSGKPAPAQADVRVLNISETVGAAAKLVDQLKAAGFKVAEPANLTPPPSDVKATTVYYGDGEGEKATAEAVGKNLGAPVERRISVLNDQPPGVIVLVTG
jgi:LytR cell envelope-related transcriptional attenuator